MPAREGTRVASGSARLTPYQRRLLVFLSVATFFEGYDVMALSQILPNLRADLGLSKATGGLLIAGANAGAIAAWWLVRRADWWGRRRTLAVTIAGYTLFTFATAFATGALSFGVLQFLARAFLLAEWEISLIYAAEEFAADRRPRTRDRCDPGLLCARLGAVRRGGTAAARNPVRLAGGVWRGDRAAGARGLRAAQSARNAALRAAGARDWRRAREARILRRAARTVARARLAARSDLVPQLLLHAECDDVLEGVRARRTRLERRAGGHRGEHRRRRLDAAGLPGREAVRRRRAQARCARDLWAHGGGRGGRLLVRRALRPHRSARRRRLRCGLDPAAARRLQHRAVSDTAARRCLCLGQQRHRTHRLRAVPGVGGHRRRAHRPSSRSSPSP